MASRVRPELILWVLVDIDLSMLMLTTQRRAIDILFGVESTMKPAKKDTRKSPKSTMASGKKPTGFTDEERAAMKERVQELKADARRGRSAGKTDEEGAVLAKIGALPQPDRDMAERLHAIIKANAPALSAKTWYGMPAYAKNGNVVCFFQSAQKFKTRYATLGFSDKANLDEGHMWATAFALKDLTAAEETRIGALIKKAIT
jgi:uncharacterized protein YdhG (YjbR/CyaY superfamily)